LTRILGDFIPVQINISKIQLKAHFYCRAGRCNSRKDIKYVSDRPSRSCDIRYLPVGTNFRLFSDAFSGSWLTLPNALADFIV
jgi:hypothetical protein